MRRSVVIVPDMHVPHHDEAAVAVVTGVLRRVRPDVVVQLGDLCDMTPFSRHSPTGMREAARDLGHDYLRDTLQPAAEILASWRRYSRRIVLVEGNHEHWVSRWCATNGPAGHALWSLIDPQKHLPVDHYEPYIPDDGGAPQHYEIFPESSAATALWAVHGYTHSRRAAAAHLARTLHQVSIVHGHTHRLQDERLICPVLGREIRAISAGCLSRPQPYYRHGSPSGYQHGYVIAYQRGDAWAAYPCAITRGSTIMPSGEEVTA